VAAGGLRATTASDSAA
jgi:putative ABC transport system substrate-binding protein